MHDKQPKEHAKRSWLIALALGCAFLLVFAATIQVAHIHSAAQESHAGCALCATAHVVISPAVPVAAPVFIRQGTTQVVDLQPTFTRSFLDFSLYRRPPPVGIAFS